MKASVFFGSVLCACTLNTVHPAAAGEPETQSGTGKIGISLPTQNVERFNKEGRFLKEAFEGEGYEVSLYFAGDNDLSIQQHQLDRMVDDNCDLIIVSPVDSYKLDEQLGRAKAKGIKVLSYGSLLMDTDAVDYLVTFDPWSAGEMQGNYLRTALNLDKATPANPKNIEVFSGVTTDSASKVMFQGAMSVLEPYINRGVLTVGSGVKDFAAASVGRSDDDAVVRMDRLVASQGYAPEGVRLDGVLCPNDNAAAAVITSLKRAGYTSENMPRITGQDCSAAGVHNIELGLQGMSVFEDGRVLANTAVRITDSILAGKTARITDLGIRNGAKDVPAWECQPEYVADGKYADILVKNGYLTRSEIDNPF